MKTTVKVLGLGIAMIGFIACTQINSPNRAEFSYVEVVGTAKKEVEPDIFYLKFYVHNHSDEQRMLAVLQSLDINTKNDLTVTDVSSGRDYKKKWYQYKRYLLKVCKFDLVTKICNKLDTLKIGYDLSDVSHSQIMELRKEVQQEAVKNARQKAENLLNSENKQTGELIYLQENEAIRYIDVDASSHRFTTSEDTGYEPPAFKKIKISYSIIARFSIQ